MGCWHHLSPALSVPLGVSLLESWTAKPNCARVFDALSVSLAVRYKVFDEGRA